MGQDREDLTRDSQAAFSSLERRFSPWRIDTTAHRSDQEEFYQLLTYKDDVDLNRKLEEWERFYNYDRPHGAFKGRTPYEVLRSLLR